MKHPLNLASQDFADHKYAYYEWMRENAPVYEGRISVMKMWFLTRYDDCVDMLRDPRFLRNRSTVTGGSRLPFPLPRSISLLVKSMIQEDEPDHRRLRRLVQQAFTTDALSRLEGRIERLTHELLDRAEKLGEIDLMKDYALPIPVTVISEMMGISSEQMPKFTNSLRVLSEGFSGWNIVRTILFDMPNSVKFVRELVPGPTRLGAVARFSFGLWSR